MMMLVTEFHSRDLWDKYDAFLYEFYTHVEDLVVQAYKKLSAGNQRYIRLIT